LQQCRQRKHAAYRLRILQQLRGPAAEAGIPIPVVRRFDLEASPPWAIYETLPGVALPEAGEAALDGPRFPVLARRMGELLPSWRRLSGEGMAINDEWADVERLAERATAWAGAVPELSGGQCGAVARVIAGLPELFRDRPTVLAHGDFAPVNVLTDGERVTGLVDLESVRLADPLFDPAWWAWTVSFYDRAVFARAWIPFLQGAGVDPEEARLTDRIRTLQVLRMLELAADPEALGADVRRVVVGQLQASLTGPRTWGG